MLSIVRYSLLLREVRGKGLIENDITDIFLIGQYGFDGTLRPLSHFSRIFASNIVSYSTSTGLKNTTGSSILSAAVS